MSDINTVIISGHLVSDPKLIPPGNHPQVRCQFKVTTRDDDGESRTFLVETRGKFAEVCQKYLKPGRQVIASGKIFSNYWDGFLVMAKQVQFLGMDPKYETPPAELAPKPLLAWGEAPTPCEETAEPFIRKEQVLLEYPPVGRYRVRLINREEARILDIREYFSTPEFEGFTTKGIRLTDLDQVRLLRDALEELLVNKFPPVWLGERK
jgi:single-stranded DNA-binding protein